MLLAQSLVNAVIQVAAVMIVSFAYWTVIARKETPFLRWLGLKTPAIRNGSRLGAIFIAIVLLFSLMSFVLIPRFTRGTELATDVYAGRGIAALVPVLIYSFLQTGLSEEVFFRGLLGKRFIAALGFVVGNTLQSGLFGLLHGVMFRGAIGTSNSIVIILYTGAIGWIMGYMNEKESGGSIVPSWLLHGLANFVASMAVALRIL